ncbi:MAG: DUF3429 domain-containing protein [Amaricoccus sp.]
MTRIPLPVLALGWLGLVPFLYGVALLFSQPGTLPTFGVVVSSPQGGLHVLERFGAAVLAFMGGCLWAFVLAPGRVPRLSLLIASGVPAVLAFVAIRPSAALSCIWLAFGFMVLQAIDVLFQRIGVAPDYWLGLRLPLTAGVMACLLLGGLYG